MFEWVGVAKNVFDNREHIGHLNDWCREDTTPYAGLGNFVDKMCDVGWREGGGIEPPSRRSSARMIGFEARSVHQDHIPPIC